MYFEHSVSFHVVLKAEFVESLQFIFRIICLFMHYTCVLVSLFRLIPLSPPPHPPPPPPQRRGTVTYILYICVCVCVYIYTHTHARAHTHTHTMNHLTM